MIAIFTAIVAFCDLLKKSSKNILYFTIFFLWVIMAFTYGNADEPVYISRYNHPELWSTQTEFIYSGIMQVFRGLGFSFYQYKAVITAIQLILIGSTVKKYAKYPNLVMVLYFVYPFMLNVAQMRNALATSVFVFGIRYLIDDDGRKLKILKKYHLTIGDIKYIVCVLIATGIHAASMLWLVLLLAKKCSLKFNILFVIIFNVLISFVVTPNNIMKILSRFGVGSRISSYLTTEYQNSEWRHYGVIILVFLISLLVCMIFSYINKHRSSFCLEQDHNIIINMNVLILIICGIIFRYTSEAYRLQEGLAIINYIFITNTFLNKNVNGTKKTISHCVVCLMLICYVCFAAGYLIWAYNMELIFWPIFNNNMLIDILI